MEGLFIRQGFLGRILDWLMVPLMYLVQGNLFQVPQRTHFWNNQKITNFADITRLLHQAYFIEFKSDPAARKRYFLGFIPFFHLPLLGGWRRYVVIQPQDATDEWFVGWYTQDAVGISRIPLRGPVRVLRGPANVSFFGVTEGGEALPLIQIGSGTIGLPDQFSRIPLR